MQKIIVRLKGGLGNQLFLLASAYRYAIKNNCELIIDERTGFKFDHLYKRSYQLYFFNASFNFAKKEELLEPFGRYRRYFAKKFRIFLSNNFYYYTQIGTDLDQFFLNNKINTKILYYDGFGQSEKYFYDIKDQLINKLSVPSSKKIPLKFIKKLNNNCVSVHFRFFDIKDPLSELNLKDDYYRIATRLISKKIKKPIFYIFSDNAELAKIRAKKIFSSYQYLIVNDLNIPDINNYEFQLMSSFTNHIIANSTFSWWAAWISEHVNNNVNIYAPGISLESSNYVTSWGFPYLIPERWEII